MMDDKKWWLVEGVIVEGENTILHYLTKIYDRFPHTVWGEFDCDNYTRDITNCKPRGVPFGCMPAWAKEIIFSSDGISFHFRDVEDVDNAEFSNGIDFHKCPEKWYGKTFEITDELRELLK